MTDTLKSGDYEALKRCEKAVGISSLRDESVILDVGCGNSVLKKAIREIGLDPLYYGIDKEQNECLAYDFRDQYSFYDIEKGIRFNDSMFDTIFALEIVEHCKNPFKVFSELSRILKKNGELIVSVPNIFSVWEYYNNFKSNKTRQNHYFNFTEENVSDICANYDLKVVQRAGTTFRVPVVWRLLEKFHGKGYRLAIKTDNVLFARSFIYKIIKS